MNGAPLAVVALGNALAGDDGVGEALAVALEARGVPEGVRVRFAASDPLALVEELAAGRRVLVVDACRFGAEPAAACVLRLDDPALHHDGAAEALHGLPLARVAQLATALGLPLGAAWLFGIEPGRLDPGTELSPAVAAALPALTERLRAAVLRISHGHSPEGVLA